MPVAPWSPRVTRTPAGPCQELRHRRPGGPSPPPRSPHGRRPARPRPRRSAAGRTRRTASPPTPPSGRRTRLQQPGPQHTDRCRLQPPGEAAGDRPGMAVLLSVVSSGWTTTVPAPGSGSSPAADVRGLPGAGDGDARSLSVITPPTGRAMERGCHGDEGRLPRVSRTAIHMRMSVTLSADEQPQPAGREPPARPPLIVSIEISEQQLNWSRRVGSKGPPGRVIRPGLVVLHLSATGTGPP